MTVKSILLKLVDPYILRAMLCKKPIVTTANTLMQFFQKRNVYVGDFIGGLL